MAKTIDELVKAEEVQKKPILRGVKKITKPEKGDFAKELERINDLTENTNKLASYVILILVVMVATMLLMVWNMVIDANNRKTDSNSYLIDKISSLENKFDLAVPKKK
jgi:hypothetical protein